MYTMLPTERWTLAARPRVETVEDQFSEEFSRRSFAERVFLYNAVLGLSEGRLKPGVDYVVNTRNTPRAWMLSKPLEVGKHKVFTATWCRGPGGLGTVQFTDALANPSQALLTDLKTQMGFSSHDRREAAEKGVGAPLLKLLKEADPVERRALIACLRSVTMGRRVFAESHAWPEGRLEQLKKDRALWLKVDGQPVRLLRFVYKDVATDVLVGDVRLGDELLERVEMLDDQDADAEEVQACVDTVQQMSSYTQCLTLDVLRAGAQGLTTRLTLRNDKPVDNFIRGLAGAGELCTRMKPSVRLLLSAQYKGQLKVHPGVSRHVCRRVVEALGTRPYVVS